MMTKRELDDSGRRLIRREIGVLQRLRGHRHIVAMLDVFETPHHLYICLEYCSGGELFEELLRRSEFSERESAEIIRQIADALSFIHRQQIVHRDLKLENLLISDSNPMTVKISDFGIAKQLRSETECKTNGDGSDGDGSSGDGDGSGGGDGMATLCGTLFYVAPEILRDDGYDEKVDCWSLGVIAYCLVCGALPFYSEDDAEVTRLVLKGQYDLRPLAASEAAKHLIQSLLTMDKTSRLSAEQVLSHRFIAGQSKKLRKRQSLRKRHSIKQMFRGMVHAAKHSLGTEPDLKAEARRAVKAVD